MKTIAPTVSPTTHKHLSLVASLSYKTTHNKIATSSLSHPKKKCWNSKTKPNFLLETFTCLFQKQKKSKSIFFAQDNVKNLFVLAPNNKTKLVFCAPWKKEKKSSFCKAPCTFLERCHKLSMSLELPRTLAKLNKCTRIQLMTKFIWAPFVMQKLIYDTFDVWSFHVILGIPTHVLAK